MLTIIKCLVQKNHPTTHDVVGWVLPLNCLHSSNNTKADFTSPFHLTYSLS